MRREGEWSKMDTCCPKRASGSALNQAAGVRGQLLTPQGAALDAGSYGGFLPGPSAAPRPAAQLSRILAAGTSAPLSSPLSGATSALSPHWAVGPLRSGPPADCPALCLMSPS